MLKAGLDQSLAAAPSPRRRPGPLHRHQGEVVHGRKLGRTLGFPTANLPLGESAPDLRYGVYAVRARLADGRWFDGVANAGVNPTVGGAAPVLETFIFDLDEDLYGQTITVELWAYLREERKFPNLKALVSQIHSDVAAARKGLAASC